MIIGSLGVMHNFPNSRTIGRLDATTEGKRQKFFGKGAGENLRPIEQPLLQPAHARELTAIRQAAGSIDRFAFLERPPATNGIEVFERKANGIHHVMATGADRISTMFGEAFAHRKSRR